MHPFRRALQKTRKKLSTDHNHDIHGLWLVVDSEEDCYLALKMVHRLWPEVPGKYMGYITNPKFNKYQSLHIVVLGEHLGPLEVQIRKKTCIYKRNLVSLHIGGFEYALVIKKNALLCPFASAGYMEITRNTDHDIMTLDGSIPIARTESMKGWLLFLLFPFSLTTRLGVPVARNNPTLKSRCTSHVDVYKIAATMIDMPYQHPHSYKRDCFGNQPFPHQLCDDSIP